MDILSTIWNAVASYVSDNWAGLLVFVAVVTIASAIGEYRARKARKAANKAAQDRENKRWDDHKNFLRYSGLMGDEGRKK